MRIPVLALVLGGFALTQAQIQPVGAAGSIDWGKRVVIATGIGAPPPNVPLAAARPNAMRAAFAVAMRNALEVVKGIRINSTTTIENACVTNDAISTSINGFVKTFEQKGKTRYMSDGSVEVTYEIGLDGDLMTSILPAVVAEKPSITTLPPVKAPKTVFTGLIVDCKGLGVTPAIAPRLLDEADKEVYGTAYVSREWAAKYGLAGYAKTMEEAARLADRIGENPGVIKAIRVTGANKTDAVVSKRDADSIRSAAENLKFLSECKVVFVVD